MTLPEDDIVGLDSAVDACVLPELAEVELGVWDEGAVLENRGVDLVGGSEFFDQLLVASYVGSVLGDHVCVVGLLVGVVV